jgi:hexosaminidase
MKTFSGLLLISFIATLSFAQSSDIIKTVFPTPQKIEHKNKDFIVDSTLYFHVTEKIDSNVKHYLFWAGERMAHRANKMLVVDLQSDTSYHRKGIWIHFETLSSPCHKLPESYCLEINDKVIKVKSSTSIGTIRALETITHLLYQEEGIWKFPGVHIDDAPSYSWRGLLIDVSRHFIPVAVLKRNIDAMAACKMNVLHLHLSDDQGFRVESKQFPLLHQAASNHQYYTQQQILNLVEYASDRGVRIVPEFDVPAHTSAMIAAYPALASKDTVYHVEQNFGIFKPVLDVSKESTYEFLDKFIQEMSSLFKDSVFHIGGDEVRSDDWMQNKNIQAFMAQHHLQDQHALQGYFNLRLEKIVQKYGKKMMGWDEVLDCKPSKSTIIQSWRSDERMQEAIQGGYATIRSNGYYLDQTYTAGQYFSRRIHDADTSNQVLGLEAAMWSELVDSNNIESRLWPNAAAIAELAWNKNVSTDTLAFYERLIPFSTKLTRIGLKHEQLFNTIQTEQEVFGKDSMYFQYLSHYVAPQDGYLRHKHLKQKGLYNEQLVLNTHADLVKPSSLAYLEFSHLVGMYEMTQQKVYQDSLDILFHEWIQNYEHVQMKAMKNKSLQSCVDLYHHLAQAAKYGLHILHPHGKEHVQHHLIHLKKLVDAQGEITLSVLPVLIDWSSRKK